MGGQARTRAEGRRRVSHRPCRPVRFVLGTWEQDRAGRLRFRSYVEPPERTEVSLTDGSVMAEPPRPLKVKAFGITDKGKVRPANEDQFLIAELTKAMRVWQTSLPEPKVQVGEERAHLFLVADGMGGHQAGERASALAVVAIEQFTLNTFKWFFGANER